MILCVRDAFHCLLKSCKAENLEENYNTNLPSPLLYIRARNSDTEDGIRLFHNGSGKFLLELLIIFHFFFDIRGLLWSSLMWCSGIGAMLKHEGQGNELVCLYILYSLGYKTGNRNFLSSFVPKTEFILVQHLHCLLHGIRLRRVSRQL